tara:strand:- start:1061 stop:2863 length:1803 start_codon:yes stop_codon:yes gene_type:complete
MIILGINFGHDSSVCILKDGKIIAAIEEEKVSRVKQDFGWPRKSIDRLFDEYNIRKEDVNLISLDKMILEALSSNEIEYRFSKNVLKKNIEYLNRITSYMGFSKRKIGEKNDELLKTLISDEGFINAKLNYYDHHLSHAASAYFTSPIETDLVITSDGMGGDSSFNFYIPENETLKLIHKNEYHVSIGGFYSMITKLLGFRPTRHEGKITGLAAYGKNTELVNKFMNLWKYENGKLNRYPFNDLDNQWIKHKINSRLSVSEKINLTNSSGYVTNDYSKRNRVLYAELRNITEGYSKEDIAFACQKVSENITLNEIDLVINKLRLKNVKVALAGGVFANVRINQKIYEMNDIANIFIHPAMGDSGLAMGNAILSDIEFGSKEYCKGKYSLKHTYLGPNYSSDLIDFINKFDESEIEFFKMENPSLEIAKLLFNNKIIGLWNGRLEWGPRALGSRSIILNTFDKSVNDSLNNRLNRTEFMPFAPVVLDIHAKKYFPKYDSNVPAADYMTMTYDTDPKYHKLLQATVHIDGTARPQIAYKDTSPFYYSILSEFNKISSCGALVNTSFNAHEEPILSTPETAINALVTNRVDYLVLEEYLFFKK